MDGGANRCSSGQTSSGSTWRLKTWRVISFGCELITLLPPIVLVSHARAKVVREQELAYRDPMTILAALGGMDNYTSNKS